MFEAGPIALGVVALGVDTPRCVFGMEGSKRLIWSIRSRTIFFFFFKHIKIDGDIFSWSKMAYFGIFRLDSVFLFVFWVGCPVNTGLWR